MSKYEIQTYSLCDGWKNTWHVIETNGEEKLETFNTKAEAITALKEFFQDIEEEIASGEREADEGYNPEDFRIVKIKPRTPGV